MSSSRVLLLTFVLAPLVSCDPDPPPPPPPEFTAWELADLTAAEGISLRTPVFEVPAGKETQDCYFVQVPDINAGQDIWVSRIHTAINPGSHHMNVFRVKTANNLNPDAGEVVDMGNGITGKLVRGGEPPMGECWKSPNWAEWPLVANSQNSDPTDPYTNWNLPEGVATRFTPGEWLMLQTHYVNATTQVTKFQGRVGVNFHKYSGAAATPQELGTLFATQQSIRVCRSNPTPSYSGTCSFAPTRPVTVVAANGHFHSRGKAFSVYAWDGVSTETPPDAARFYRSESWDDPPMSTDLNVAPPMGGGIYWTCDFQWSEPQAGCAKVDARDPQAAGDCCFTFGGIVEASEHCNVFLYYYPKVERTDIFCN